MKKVISFVLAAVLCLSMSTTVLAAGSPSADKIPSEGSGSPSVDNTDDNYGSGSDSKEQGAVIIVDGQPVSVAISVKTVEEAYEELSPAQQENISGILETLNSANASEIAAMWANLVKDVAGAYTTGFGKLVDVALPEGMTNEDIPESGIKITIQAAGVTAGMDMGVLHMKANGAWEYVNAVAGDGVITFTLYSLSPVYYFEETPASWYYDPAIDGPVDPSTSVSPKTADNNMALYTVMLAMVALTGVVYTKRKAR